MSVFFVGLSFWKCGSRKIYAVRVTTHVPLKRSAKSKAKASYSSCYDISDDSDEDFTPKKTRGDNHGDIQIVNSQIRVSWMVLKIIIYHFYLADVISIQFHENKQRYIEIIKYCGCSNS